MTFYYWKSFSICIMNWEDDTIDIHSETFSSDYDDIDFEGHIEDDSDTEEEHKYGLVD